MGPLEEIAKKIVEMTLPDFLNWLAATGFLANLSKDQLDKVYSLIRGKYNEGKYAFVPDKDEIYTLKKLGNRSLYKEFKRLLPGYWGVDVVRSALYVSLLEIKGDIDRIQEIRAQVFKNRKTLGIRLVEMTTIGLLDVVVVRLDELQDKQSYSKEELQNEFDEILTKWNSISIFIKNTDSLRSLYSRAEKMIDDNEPTFFVLAKGDAIKKAQKVATHLVEKKDLLGRQYDWNEFSNVKTEPPSSYIIFSYNRFTP